MAYDPSIPDLDNKIDDDIAAMAANFAALAGSVIVDHNLDTGTTDFYIRWANGLQFCFGLVNMGTYDINTAFGDLFVSSAVTATFAAGFDTVLFPNTAMNTNSSIGPLWAAHHSVTPDSLKVNVYSPIEFTNRTEGVSYAVWGTWSE